MLKLCKKLRTTLFWVQLFLICYAGIALQATEQVLPQLAAEIIQPHPAYKNIDHELRLIAAAIPEQTTFFISKEATPHLYEFLMPTLQRFCKAANIAQPPHLFVLMGNSWESYNAQASFCGIRLGENFIRLFLSNKLITTTMFSLIAHELGHFFYELQNNPQKASSEQLADVFATTITKDQEALITAIILTTITLYFVSALDEFIAQNNSIKDLSIEEKRTLVISVTMFVYQLIKQSNYTHIINEIPHNKIFSLLFTAALQSITNHHYDTPATLTRELEQALNGLYNAPETLRNFVHQIPSHTTTHPPLSARISHILSLPK